MQCASNLKQSGRGAPLKEMDYQRNNREKQQEVDECTGNMEHDKAADPGKQQNKKQNNKHFRAPFF